MQYGVAVFDFDGTLADTFHAIAASTDIALTEAGLPPVDQTVLRSAIGLSLPAIFRKVVGDAVVDVDSLVSTYRAVFGEVAAAKVRLFDGIGEQLVALRRAGVVLTVATSKSRRGVDELLDALGIADFFAAVVADDMVTAKKPDPEMLHTALTAVGAGPTDAVMIGDAEFDIQMGQAGGTATCAVTWGNGARERLVALGPDYVVNEPGDLARMLLADVGGVVRR